eukprot:TRINITY_DN2115_c0_g1_i2.p1 TRINITY_DN2115_c0_g1~~TRINITY_DN2115_c0_g1_i2.p1  ORF type:complete len:103 (+),score=35.94 TRINITY_DN2115_c0_g1_i2:138-446(+)
MIDNKESNKDEKTINLTIDENKKDDEKITAKETKWNEEDQEYSNDEEEEEDGSTSEEEKRKIQPNKKIEKEKIEIKLKDDIFYICNDCKQCTYYKIMFHFNM